MAILKLLDVLLAFFLSVLTGSILHLIVSPVWNGFLAMVLGMAVGMILPVIFLFLPIPFLSDFEVMVPGMFCAMFTGMFEGMALASSGMDWGHLFVYAAGITLSIETVFYLYNRRLHGAVELAPAPGDTD